MCTVSRVEATSDSGMHMQLDVAIEVYPMCVGDKFRMVLASTLNLDGTPDTGYFTQAGGETLADGFQYVMQGKLYRIANYVKPPPPPPPEKDGDKSKKDEDTSEKDAEASAKKDAEASAQKDADTYTNDDTSSNEDPKLCVFSRPSYYFSFREVLASFGGLLMALRGEPSFAKTLNLDNRIFLLIRKV
ncbi:hypothetical protein HU200_009513 [Digitaria exilis]|uniref:Uncharacterized protein n=1 Tax=Digitaria exilis TaxID=1010633 RepID=A0A835FJU2_9POAL|nr:hypothetical protein HU200_009513 [Digitaria exilis]